MSTPDMHDASNPFGPEPGRALPVIDRNRCEGRADCVRVCLYDLFRVEEVPADERRAMSVIGRLKLRAQGWRQAYAVSAADCHLILPVHRPRRQSRTGFPEPLLNGALWPCPIRAQCTPNRPVFVADSGAPAARGAHLKLQQ
jgi:NAD-dependent dihydropyrimidine dehydrogenase PreA subunit